jgi:hypothetical protein
MKCPSSISSERLAELWLGDLPEQDALELEDHVFVCTVCDASLRRFAAIGQGVRIVEAMRHVPPLLTKEQLSDLRARGLRLEVEHLEPGATSMRAVDPSLDGLAWFLHAELAGVQRVSLELCRPDGTRILFFAEPPVDREASAVILACSRHTAQVELESRVRLLDGDGGRVLAEYRLVHRAVESL